MTNAITRRAGGSFESDRDLVDAIDRRDKLAIEYFFDKYSRLFYSQIHKRIEYQDVDEIFQEFFVYISNKNFRVICNWHGDCKLTTWICIVLHNFISRYIRKQQRNPGSEDLDENMADPEGPNTDLPVEILGEEMKRTLEQAMVKWWQCLQRLGLERAGSHMSSFIPTAHRDGWCWKALLYHTVKPHPTSP